MFADLDRNEHRRFPLLKLIDFGLANPNEFAIEENISAVGSVRANLASISMPQYFFSNHLDGTTVNLENSILGYIWAHLPRKRFPTTRKGQEGRQSSGSKSRPRTGQVSGEMYFWKPTPSAKPFQPVLYCKAKITANLSGYPRRDWSIYFRTSPEVYLRCLILLLLLPLEIFRV